ncbi:MAG: RNA polymerase sigma factor SigW [Parcubacteria group bacterium GW2011_GWA2_43_11]|nr:MAG: RNA polymerase sigma factor SigW [Parcubacteria group bacterium GW2011_GWA2_43_11]
MKQEKAYLEAFEKYADVLYRHAFFRVSDAERAKDIVSDTFMRTWDYIGKGNTIDNFRPFLYRTLNHLIIDEYRKKKTESLDSILNERDVPEGVFDELIEGSLEEVEFSLDAKRIPLLLEQMPKKHQEVVLMRFVDGLLPAEIADILGEPVNTVSVRIHRGVTWLRKNADLPVSYTMTDNEIRKKRKK